jgi:hypothetical protein
MEEIDTVVALFEDHPMALTVAKRYAASGLDMKNLSIIGKEGLVVGGGRSALGAAMYSIGIQGDSVIDFETALRADNILMMAHGTVEEMVCAKAVLGSIGWYRLGAHAVNQAATRVFEFSTVMPMLA